MSREFRASVLGRFGLVVAVLVSSLHVAGAQPVSAPTEDLDTVRKLLQSDISDNRIKGIKMLDGSTSAAATNLLLEALKDFDYSAYPGSSVNLYAMEILAKRKEPRAFGQIVGLLTPRMIRHNGKAVLWDCSDQVAAALGQLGDPRAAPSILGVLIARLESNLRQTRQITDAGLYVFNPPEPPLSIDAHITTLGQFKHTAAAPVIIRALRATRPVRYLGDGSKPPTLSVIPVYPRTDKRRKVLFDALAAMPGESTTNALVSLLVSPTSAESDLKDAEAILIEQNDSAAIWPLLGALRDHAAMAPAQLSSITRTLTHLTNDPAPSNDPEAWLKWSLIHPPTTQPK